MSPFTVTEPTTLAVLLTGPTGPTGLPAVLLLTDGLDLRSDVTLTELPNKKGHEVTTRGSSLQQFQFLWVPGFLGSWTLSIVRYSTEHNVPTEYISPTHRLRKEADSVSETRNCLPEVTVLQTDSYSNFGLIQHNLVYITSY
jgi:hypothetical protein